MNTIDILHYGHMTLASTVDGLPEADWHTPGVCGIWSVKDIVAHLASFEHLLIDVLQLLIEESATPTLDSFKVGIEQFNAIQVQKRQGLSVADVWTDYKSTYQRTISLLTQIPVGRRRLNGLLPWYGPEYDVEDFIVYSFYGHKREHSAQIAIYRDRLAAAVAATTPPAR